MSYQSINPYDGKIQKAFEEFTDEQLEIALKTSAACFETWRSKTFHERSIVASRVSALLRKNLDGFAKLATLEMGKLLEEARGEVALSADIIDYYAINAEGFPLAASNRATIWSQVSTS